MTHTIKTFNSEIKITKIEDLVSILVDGVLVAEYHSDTFHEMNYIIKEVEDSVLSILSDEEVEAATAWYHAKKANLDYMYSIFENNTQRPKGHEFVKLFPAMPFKYGSASCFSRCPLIPGSEFN